MSSYPPTPSFGAFNFVTQLPSKPAIAAPVPHQPPARGLASPPSSVAENSASQPAPVSQVMPAQSTASCGLPPKPKRRAGESSDSMEEGELSDGEEQDSNSGKTRDSDSSNGTRQLEQEPTVDVPTSSHPSNCLNDRNQRYRPKPSAPVAPRPPPPKPQQTRARSRKNERGVGTVDKGFNPPSYPKSMVEDREKQGYRRASTTRNGNAFPNGPKNGISPSNRPATLHKVANAHGAGRARTGNFEPDRNLLKEAQKALRDMDTCKVSFSDLLQETGLSSSRLKKLFASVGLAVPTKLSPSPAPQSNNKPESQLTSLETAKPTSIEMSTESIVLDPHTQRLRKQLEREVRDKERKEAEAKAAELARRREVEQEEEERQRRTVEVEAAREAFRKKMESLNLKKPATPGVPPTPISSTPVLAAIAQSRFVQHPLIPPVPKIPGLLLSQQESLSPAEDTSSGSSSHGSDVIMRDVSEVIAHLPSPGASPDIPAELNGIVQTEKLMSRRKRPVASDLYTDQNPAPIKRRFGAQRSSSVIIEISDDEDDDSEMEHVGHALIEHDSLRQTHTATPTSNGNSNNNNGLRRLQALASSGTPTNSDQADALRKKEAEIQRLKDQIMAAQQKKKLMKNGVSNAPTPTATPPVGLGPTAPPQNSPFKSPIIKPRAASAAVDLASSDKQQIDVTKSDTKISKDTAKQKNEQFRTTEHLNQEKLQDLLIEAEKIADFEIQKKEIEAANVKREAEKIEQERQEKRRQLMEVDSGWEQKRIAMEDLKAQMEKIQREQQEMEEKKKTLAKEIEEIEKQEQVNPNVQNELSNKLGKAILEVDRDDNPEEVTDLASEDPKPAFTAEPKPEYAPPVVNTVDAEPTRLEPSLPVSSTNEDISMPDAHPEPAISQLKPPSDTDKHSVPANASPELQSPSSSLSSNDMEVEPQSESTNNGHVSEGVDMDQSSSEEEEDSEESSDEGSDDSEEEMSPTKPVPKTDDSTATEKILEADAIPQNISTTPVPVPSCENTNLDATVAVPEQPRAATVETTSEKSKLVPNNFTPYTSPLSAFKSFRYHPHLLEFCPNGAGSLTYSNRLDPYKQMCRYEVNGGVCNASSCRDQHFREISMNDDEILVEMAHTSEGATPDEIAAYATGLRETIVEMKGLGVMDFKTVVKGIAHFRRKFLGDETRIIKLPA